MAMGWEWTSRARCRVCLHQKRTAAIDLALTSAVASLVCPFFSFTPGTTDICVLKWFISRNSLTTLRSLESSHVWHTIDKHWIANIDQSQVFHYLKFTKSSTLWVFRRPLTRQDLESMTPASPSHGEQIELLSIALASRGETRIQQVIFVTVKT